MEKDTRRMRGPLYRIARFNLELWRSVRDPKRPDLHFDCNPLILLGTKRAHLLA